MCFLSMYCIHHLVNRMLDSPAFKVLRKIGDKIHSRTLAKNGDQLNESLSQETIFLAMLYNPEHDQGVELRSSIKELQPLVRIVIQPVSYIVNRDFKYRTLIALARYQICMRII